MIDKKLDRQIRLTVLVPLLIFAGALYLEAPPAVLLFLFVVSEVVLLLAGLSFGWTLNRSWWGDDDPDPDDPDEVEPQPPAAVHFL